MNIGDMHISVQQGVDKINSQHSDLLLPEEIDLELNKNIQRFINQRFNSRGTKYQVGFEQSQKRIDDIRTLIVEQSVPCFFKGQVFAGIFSDTCEFPNNYMHLINLKTLIRNQQCKTMCYNETEVITVPAQVNYSLGSGTCLDFAGVDFNNIALYYYNANGLAIQATVTSSGLASITQLSYWLVNPTNWIGDIIVTNEGAFNFVVTLLSSETPPGIGGEYKYDNLGGSEQTCITHTYVKRIAQFNTKRVACDDITTNTLVGQNKFAQHDDIFTLLSDPFNTTTYKSPLYTIRDSSLDIYTDDTFIVEAAKMTYLKRPATVDFGNTVNCDLPVSVHQEVVDMTVNTILEGISDPRYQSTNMEVLKSE